MKAALTGAKWASNAIFAGFVAYTFRAEISSGAAGARTWWADVKRVQQNQPNLDKTKD